MEPSPAAPYEAHPTASAGIGEFNRAIAWSGFAAGAGMGLIMGMWSFDGPVAVPALIGEYGDTARRLLRLGHIALFGLGILNLLLVRNLPTLPLGQRAHPGRTRVHELRQCLSSACPHRGRPAAGPQVPDGAAGARRLRGPVSRGRRRVVAFPNRSCRAHPLRGNRPTRIPRSRAGVRGREQMNQAYDDSPNSHRDRQVQRMRRFATGPRARSPRDAGPRQPRPARASVGGGRRPRRLLLPTNRSRKSEPLPSCATR